MNFELLDDEKFISLKFVLCKADSTQPTLPKHSGAADLIFTTPGDM